MRGRPSEAEMQRRIVALLMTRTAGQAVARRLGGQAEECAHRAAIAELRARRIEAVIERQLEALRRLGAEPGLAALERGCSGARPH
jgi:hypothetical protein